MSMTPLIQTFAKTLQPCSGCGTQEAASVWATVPASANPNMKQYLMQVVVEAEKASEAMAKAEGIGEVISQSLRPSQGQGQAQTSGTVGVPQMGPVRPPTAK